jgi:hypothetical protein
MQQPGPSVPSHFRTPSHFADHVHGLVAGNCAPSFPERPEMLTGADLALDGPSNHNANIQRVWFPRCKAKVDRAVTEDDLIGSLRVNSAISAPGQVALFDSRNIALIVGDPFRFKYRWSSELAVHSRR